MMVVLVFLYGMFAVQYLLAFMVIVTILGVRSLTSYLLVAVCMPITYVSSICFKNGCPNMSLSLSAGMCAAAVAISFLYWLALRNSTRFLGSAAREGDGHVDVENVEVFRGLTLPVVLALTWLGACLLGWALPRIPGVSSVYYVPFGFRPMGILQHVALVYLASLAIIGLVSRRWLILPGAVYALFLANLMIYKYSDHPKPAYYYNQSVPKLHSGG